MAEQIANKAKTTLAAAITDPAATTITVTSATGFPDTPEFRIKIDDEIMLVTAMSGTTWTVTRAVEDAVRFPAATHLNGAKVTQSLTVQALLNVISENPGSAVPHRIALNYVPGGDITVSGVSALTWTDLTSNQNFTVDDANSLIQITASGTVYQTVNNTFTNYKVRLVIDSGGTPIYREISGTSQSIGSSVVQVNNILDTAEPQTFSGLTAGTHTVKLQVYASGADSDFTINMASGFFRLQVVEFKPARGANPGGGGADPLWTNVLDQTLDATASSITIDLPNDKDFIEIRLMGACNAANQNLYVRCNGDSGTNYDGVLTIATPGSSSLGVYPNNGWTQGYVGVLSSTANWGHVQMSLANYRKTGTRRIIGFKGFEPTTYGITQGFAVWTNTTDAITTLTLFLSNSKVFEVGTRIIVDAR